MDLLDKYAKGLISDEELEDFFKNLDNTSDKELYADLYGKWMAFSADKELSQEKKKSLYPLRVRKTNVLTVIMSIAASIFFLLAGALFWNQYRTDKIIDSMVSNTVAFDTYAGGSSKVYLPDGTSVILNSNSHLSYNSDFGINDRRVRLEGQGYFDVAKDPSKEFVVSSQGMDVKVHGTEFNVYSYPSQDIMEMSLVNGCVTLSYGRYSNDIIPNEKVVINKVSGSIRTERTDNNLETSWINGELAFENLPLRDVFDILQRKFGVAIRVLCPLDLSDHYTGVFGGSDISYVMDVLKIHYGFTYDFSDDKTTICLK